MRTVKEQNPYVLLIHMTWIWIRWSLEAGCLCQGLYLSLLIREIEMQ